MKKVKFQNLVMGHQEVGDKYLSVGATITMTILVCC